MMLLPPMPFLFLFVQMVHCCGAVCVRRWAYLRDLWDLSRTDNCQIRQQRQCRLVAGMFHAPDHHSLHGMLLTMRPLGVIIGLCFSCATDLAQQQDVSEHLSTCNINTVSCRLTLVVAPACPSSLMVIWWQHLDWIKRCRHGT